ncbi:cobalt-precorrin-5B (C(1))-methyltransferase [Oceanibium sediminis]|uniref:cobalt-precorrin-5B (C(1))-methyltransferase n=1 Tax=Oceanibium sediminis TaxID=2026339 RepID=UPI000DD32247|nr:cobalt-precorrin-5B (C(1))-methyltransferase [Oceanibium sediminis]
MGRKPDQDLRTGFTTGACATAAAKAAVQGLLSGAFPNPVTITLPRGQVVDFPLVEVASGPDWARASVQKDAGDDPDVTHGAIIIATVRRGAPGSGVTFAAGPGVGRVTMPGLPIPPGEPAINPVPRTMITGAVTEVCAELGVPGDIAVEISVPGGEELAKKTWNPRLGITGGISILGTTGIVRPFSCAAWIASIHRGIDVARANGVTHVAGATGATSEATAQRVLGLADHAMLDMGDFAGGLMKYLARHPVPYLTIAGGFGKLTKLAQGAVDLHSSRSQVDFEKLAALAEGLGVDPAEVASANTAAHALSIAGPGLAQAVAEAAQARAAQLLKGSGVAVDVMVIDRDGAVLAHAR